MDFKNLFLSANGRAGRQEFWIGFLILLVAGFVLGLVPLVNMVAGLVLIYPWVCLYSKRLHDFGKSGWLTLVPFGLGLVGVVCTVAFGGMAALTAMATKNAGGTDNAAAMSAVGAMGTMSIVWMVIGLAGIAFLLWVGLSKGDAGDNKYGPPPAKSAAATA
jgi:uncharacterized membrane protein YhaH (DUF805 family)